MSVQLTYTRETRNALPGLVADIGPYEIASRSNKTAASAPIPFGVVVGLDTADEGCVLGVGAGYLGISTRKTAKENSDVGSETEEYVADETVGVFRSGKIWAIITAGGVPGDVIKYVDATGVLDVGAPGAGETQLANAVLETTTGAGELGLIRIGA